MDLQGHDSLQMNNLVFVPMSPWKGIMDFSFQWVERSELAMDISTDNLYHIHKKVIFNGMGWFR